MTNYQYIVTNLIHRLPVDLPIVSIGEEIAYWEPESCDYLIDRQKSGKSLYILEVPYVTRIPNNSVFVAAKLNAEVCATAAWLQLLGMEPEELSLERTKELEWIKRCLEGISFDCAYLSLVKRADYCHVFARDAVITLERFNEDLASELQLPQNRREWSVAQKSSYDSVVFAKNTQWLVNAALKLCDWPGQNGEVTDVYWRKYEQDTYTVDRISRMHDNVAIVDIRGDRPEYDDLDPRHLIHLLKSRHDYTYRYQNFWLTVRDNPMRVIASDTSNDLILRHEAEPLSRGDMEFVLAAYHYEIASVPLHKCGSPRFNEYGIWTKLNEVESKKRYRTNAPMSLSNLHLWTGNNNAGECVQSILTAEEVIGIILAEKADRVVSIES
jgi:hypothetical protein